MKDTDTNTDTWFALDRLAWRIVSEARSRFAERDARLPSIGIVLPMTPPRSAKRPIHKPEIAIQTDDLPDEPSGLSNPHRYQQMEEDGHFPSRGSNVERMITGL